MKLNKFNKKIFLLIISVISILLMRINIVQADEIDLNYFGESDYNNAPCSQQDPSDPKNNWNVCIHYVGFEFSIVQVTQNNANGFKYNTVSGTKTFRIYNSKNYKIYYGLIDKNGTDKTQNRDEILDVVAEGGLLFKDIMKNTGANDKLGDNFYNPSNHYAILMKELFGILHWDNHDNNKYYIDDKDCYYFDGTNDTKNGCYNAIYKPNVGTMNGKTYSYNAVRKKALELFNVKYHKSHMGSTMFNLACNIHMETSLGNQYCLDSFRKKENLPTVLGNTGLEFNSGIIYGEKITPPPPTKGKLKLEKVNSIGTIINGKSATFVLYNNHGCGGTPITSIQVGNDGFVERELVAGKYSIKEVKAPKGYKISDECRNFTINAGKETKISFRNTQTCESEFNALSNKSNPIDRINLYKRYKKRNLLDFTITNASDACKNTTSSPKPNVKCLEYDKEYSDFNYKNLSSYTSTYSNGTVEAYCIINFELSSNLPKNNSFGNIKSGQMVINKKSSDKKAASATITKICYSYNVNSTVWFNDENFITNAFESSLKDGLVKNLDDDYIVKFNNIKLERTDYKTTVKHQTGKYGGVDYIKYTIKVNYDYNLEPVYSKFGTGEVESSKSTSNKFLGYGLISKFKDNGKITVPFSVDGEEPSKNNKCYYTATPEIIEEPDGPGNPYKLNLAYRQISKSNPFPGINGAGRNVGSNWCEGKKCTQSNNTVKTYITNKNDSYNSTGKGPKYIITLNSASMAEINSKYTQEYDDFGTNCGEKNGTCASDFIEWMKTKGILKVNDVK